MSTLTITIMQIQQILSTPDGGQSIRRMQCNNFWQQFTGDPCLGHWLVLFAPSIVASDIIITTNKKMEKALVHLNGIEIEIDDHPTHTRGHVGRCTQIGLYKFW